MLEKIEQLEKCVESLISMLEESRRENQELHAKLDRMRTAVGSQTDLLEKNQDLEGAVGSLESEVAGMTDRETQIRDRLQGILARIDSLQLELTGQAQSGH